MQIAWTARLVRHCVLANPSDESLCLREPASFYAQALCHHPLLL